MSDPTLHDVMRSLGKIEAHIANSHREQAAQKDWNVKQDDRIGSLEVSRGRFKAAISVMAFAIVFVKAQVVGAFTKLF